MNKVKLVNWAIIFNVIALAFGILNKQTYSLLYIITLAGLVYTKFYYKKRK